MAEAYSNYTFVEHHPRDLDRDQWRALQAVLRIGFAADLKDIVDQPAVDEFVHWNDAYVFRETRIKPALAVRLGLLNPAYFARPLVIAAYDGTDPVGYIYSAETASYPSKSLRDRAEGMAKMIAPAGWPVPKVGGKRYAWQREIVVHPDVRGQGIARELGRRSVAARHPERKVTAYVHPQLLHAIADKLVYDYSMRATGQQDVQPFRNGLVSRMYRLERQAGALLGSLADAQVAALNRDA